MGAWAMSGAIALSLQMERPWQTPMPGGTGSFNPLVGTYETSDERYLFRIVGFSGQPTDYTLRFWLTR